MSLACYADGDLTAFTTTNYNLRYDTSLGHNAHSYWAVGHKDHVRVGIVSHISTIKLPYGMKHIIDI